MSDEATSTTTIVTPGGDDVMQKSNYCTIIINYAHLFNFLELLKVFVYLLFPGVL